MIELDRRGFLGWLGTLTAGGFTLSPRSEPWSEAVAIPVLQHALRHLRYLPESHDTGVLDEATERAILRFKRHARRPYRMVAATGRPDDVPLHACFSGECDLEIGEETVREIMQWLGRDWTLPLGRFRLVSLAGEDKRAPAALRYTLLREDVAEVWRKAMNDVAARGGTLAGPYGDTWRPLGYHKKDGTSRRSFHITGRAIDLNQQFAHGLAQRYFLVSETARGRQFFRIYCKTARQDGSQGTLIEAGQEGCWQFLSGRSSPIPRGYYLDLTAILAAYKFDRVPAHEGWESNYLRTEWWHYHYGAEKQETFLDECELVGVSEDNLLRAGYTLEEIDRRPG